jgi:hypothetical protein
MPLIHLGSPLRTAGSKVHSVPHNTFALNSFKLLCPSSLINVSCDTPIRRVQQAGGSKPIRKLGFGCPIREFCVWGF